MNDEEAIYRLNRIAKRIVESEGENALIFSAEYAVACDYGVSAIKTLGMLSNLLNEITSKGENHVNK